MTEQNFINTLSGMGLQDVKFVDLPGGVAVEFLADGQVARIGVLLADNPRENAFPRLIKWAERYGA